VLHKLDTSKINWAAAETELDDFGCALLPGLLSQAETRQIAIAYKDDNQFRKRIVMARHGFGRGEYKYYNYPLPDVIQELRSTLYPPLAKIANRWNEWMGIDIRYPDQHKAFVERCHAAGQDRPTPLLLQYREGDYNCMHQDIYGEHTFPYRLRFYCHNLGMISAEASSF